MSNKIKTVLRKIKGRIMRMLSQKNSCSSYNPDGIKYYDPSSEMTFQDYYVQHKDAIFEGNVPDRYTQIANKIPGKRVMEIGSADGTQSMVIARNKQYVVGLELMPQQFQASLDLKQAWGKRGQDVSNIDFFNGGISSHYDLLEKVDTLYMSRVLYHLRDEIAMLGKRILANENLKYLVLVGCPNREKNWNESGETGDAMGRYAYYASLEGMTKFAEECGFKIIESLPSKDGNDPMVIGERK